METPRKRQQGKKRLTTLVMLIRKLRWLGMEEEPQGLENELKRRRAAAADNEQLPKRINQDTGPLRLSRHVRSKQGGVLRVSLLPKRSVVACTTQIISGSKQRTTAEDAFVKQELLELAAVCEEVGKNEIDEQRTSG